MNNNFLSGFEKRAMGILGVHNFHLPKNIASKGKQLISGSDWAKKVGLQTSTRTAPKTGKQIYETMDAPVKQVASKSSSGVSEHAMKNVDKAHFVNSRKKTELGLHQAGV